MVRLEGNSVTSSFLHWMRSTMGLHAGWCSVIDAAAGVMRAAAVAGVGVGIGSVFA